MTEESFAPFCLPAARAGAPVVVGWKESGGTSLVEEIFVSIKNKTHIIAVTTNGLMIFFDSKTGEGETKYGTRVTLRMLTPKEGAVP